MAGIPRSVFPPLLSLILGCVTFGCDQTEGNASGPKSDTNGIMGQPPVEPTREVATPVFGFKLVASYPHDCKAFTQGLQYVDGVLYEGTGQNGRSTVRKVDLKTGKPFKIVSLDPQYFGEGITFLNNKLYQLTWQSQIGFVYDGSSLQRLKTFRYGTEGWGITNDGKQLIVSDGSSTLYFWDPETLHPVRKITVTDAGAPIANLNELEFIKGEIWANVWQTDRIARIDPQSGKVTAWVDLLGLLRPEDLSADCEPEVLNGIAYDAKGDRLFVTGKQWPKIYEIRLIPKE